MKDRITTSPISLILGWIVGETFRSNPNILSIRICGIILTILWIAHIIIICIDKDKNKRGGLI